MNTKIIGTGYDLPAFAADNNYLATLVDTSDEWIVERTGIRTRHLAKEETTTTMAVNASRQALERAGMQAEDVELLIVATISGDTETPSTACRVQAEIGANRAGAFDINAACSGFLYGMHVAEAFIRSGIYRNALVIGAETLSKLIDWTDRSTCVLFGDGAGAAVLAGLVLKVVCCNLVLKPLVARIRPCDVNTAVQLLITRPDDFSFPSGHTGASFAAVSALYFNRNRIWIPALMFAALIAFSRMYLYVHYPTDILAGIILGIMAGWAGSLLSIYAERKLHCRQ